MGICNSTKECKHDFDIKYEKMYCKKCGKTKDLPNYSAPPKVAENRRSIPTEEEVFGDVPTNPFQSYQPKTFAIQEKTLPKGALFVSIIDVPNVRKECIELSKKAVVKDQQGNFDEAHDIYVQCLDKLDILLAKDDNPFYQNLYNKKRNEYKERVKMIRNQYALRN